ncbi:MAG: TetR/AcrR family transcriptional regulator [Deltaproteobacteria bacterium]|nr:TetR/AcrR family transcriptional regulator [Deltaproteobacteria bacterium]
MARPRRLVPLRRARRLARRRRAPEEARQELLDAADRVFVEFQPDQVGLKDIGREAGVSHALITHYFGTYAGLIEAALERRIRKLREHILERIQHPGALQRPSELLGILFDALADPVHLRLMRWLLASERPSAAFAFGLQAQGLQLISRRVAAALSPSPTLDMIDKIELTLLTAVSAAYGYAMAKYALVGALGREASGALDNQVRDTLAAMVQSHLQKELGITIGR